MLTVRVVRLDPELPLPQPARADDAGVDLYARVDAHLAPGGGRAVVPTGIALAIPAGYAGFVQPRSGLAARHGVTCLNSPGLIDAGYRGEVAVVLCNTDPVEPYRVCRGERIAQLVLQAVAMPRFAEVGTVDELPASERGVGGFGHSGGFGVGVAVGGVGEAGVPGSAGVAVGAGEGAPERRAGEVAPGRR